MLEEKIERLTAETIKLRESMDANTAALKGGAAPAAAAAGKGAGKGKGATAAPKISADDVKAACLRVKAEVSEDAAKKVIAGSGAKGLADLLQNKADKFADVIAACEAALEGGGVEEEEDENEGL
jgi:hypothetical protein